MKNSALLLVQSKLHCCAKYLTASELGFVTAGSIRFVNTARSSALQSWLWVLFWKSRHVNSSAFNCATSKLSAKKVLFWYGCIFVCLNASLIHSDTFPDYVVINLLALLAIFFRALVMTLGGAFSDLLLHSHIHWSTLTMPLMLPQQAKFPMLMAAPALPTPVLLCTMIGMLHPCSIEETLLTAVTDSEFQDVCASVYIARSIFSVFACSWLYVSNCTQHGILESSHKAIFRVNIRFCDVNLDQPALIWHHCLCAMQKSTRKMHSKPYFMWPFIRALTASRAASRLAASEKSWSNGDMGNDRSIKWYIVSTAWLAWISLLEFPLQSDFSAGDVCIHEPAAEEPHDSCTGQDFERGLLAGDAALQHRVQNLPHNMQISLSAGLLRT